MHEVMEGRAEPVRAGGAARRPGDEGRAAGRDRRVRPGDARPCGALSAPAGDVFDTCGTGGDRSGTFNISSAAALVVAGCGVRVAKHGNRSVSSRCGSADVFERSACNITAPPAVVERTLHEAGIAFFFAPTFHPSMKHAAPVRRELGIRTAFNLLGPLTNPARRRAADRRRAAVGADRAARAALLLLGAERAWVVHGADGLDEISTTGYTKVSECRAGSVRTFYVHPSDVGCRRQRRRSAGRRRHRQRGHRRARAGGRAGPARDVVLLNAGAALFVAGRVDSRRDGLARAAECDRFGRGARDARGDGSMLECGGGGMSEAPDLLRAIVAATRRITTERREREPQAALESGRRTRRRMASRSRRPSSRPAART
jgi:anthranilate phosphoribosyltransferase